MFNRIVCGTVVMASTNISNDAMPTPSWWGDPYYLSLGL